MCGLVRPIFRLPYVPLSREQREHGAKLLRAVQEHIPGCKVGRGVGGASFRHAFALPDCMTDMMLWGEMIVASLGLQEVRVMDDEEFILIHSAGNITMQCVVPDFLPVHSLLPLCHSP